MEKLEVKYSQHLQKDKVLGRTVKPNIETPYTNLFWRRWDPTGRYFFILTVLTLLASMGMIFMFFVWFQGVPSIIETQENEIEKLRNFVKQQQDKIQNLNNEALTPRQSSTKADCSFPKDSGPCKALMPMWYFNAESNECQEFDYGGCKGNSNKFETKDACEAICKIFESESSEDFEKKALNNLEESENNGQEKDICQMKPEMGNCRASMERWYFDSESSDCKPFIWGGCGGNGNNFSHRERCEERCFKDNKRQNKSAVVTLKKEKCGLPSRTGMCRAAILRYFFNVETGECQVFMYGGCDGNENNFEKKEQCEQECKLD